MLIQTTSVTYSSASLGGLMLQNFGGFLKVTTWPMDIIEDLKRLVKQARSPARLQNSRKTTWMDLREFKSSKYLLRWEIHHPQLQIAATISLFFCTDWTEGIEWILDTHWRNGPLKCSKHLSANCLQCSLPVTTRLLRYLVRFLGLLVQMNKWTSQQVNKSHLGTTYINCKSKST